MRQLLLTLGTGMLALAIAIPAGATEATFVRDLTVTGQVELDVATGSGSIRITQGPAGHLHIFGRVHSGWGANDQQVSEIAAHPPIEQTGNIVRIGARHQNLFHNISIDYEIQAPANSFLDAASGSGGITDDGVGVNAKLNTGSGGIHATGLQGGFTAGTGSGSIYADLTGQGGVKAETGSGSIEIHNIHGVLKAETGSGSIKAEGTPAGPWHLQTGSGSVELWTGSAPFTLDASTGSGGVHCDREIAGQDSESKHHLSGKIAGGGPTVRVETGSGSIRVH